MTRVITLPQIARVLPDVDVIGSIRDGFVAYSAGLVDVPPVGELLFPEADGEMHLKYGVIRGDRVCVVKLATGFFRNPALGLAPFGGCMLVLSAETGQVLAVLLEEGTLTNHRTAAAGAVAAQALSPRDPGAIGIVGTGVQARLQADYLRRVTGCRALVVWGRSPDRAAQAAQDIAELGFDTRVAPDLPTLCDECRLIVTTTPATQPLLTAGMVRPGTHITAMGSDTADKVELAPDLVARADCVVSDSIVQSMQRGEIHQARKAGKLDPGRLVELGAVLGGTALGRQGDSDITIADLTGVAVQDIAIAKAVLAQLDRMP